ncbi:galactose mutarotase [Sansalvadorimonas sp. 2012CJ34-2]|uniref:Aldose 1-epimerase n=1 Tax=Parendozoicomonas callyspongiae TaxID=2942213 RepID=A0ABT0PC35_9GAMM|nr:aldose epimerase family protein [Sansalvadorimonas sp. 2012CJ34-2]MCL6268939.1 galactose mutarotase [Sansalvadorimonas sp. 2012CJ34-2]
MVTVKEELFGKTRAGEDILRTVMCNSLGVEVALINYGATIQAIRTPDRYGNLENIVLSCDSVANYERQGAYLGTVAGRTANRTAKGMTVIAGKEYHFACNNGPNHLHGGNCGFNRKVWQQSITRNENSASVTMSYLSIDGEENYPGNLNVAVIYTLTEENQLHAVYKATTDKTTLVNLTQHSYFNLAGKGDCLGHILQLDAEHYLPTDPTAIPTGELADVAGTPFDFRIAKPIGQNISEDHPQLEIGKGYDHNFCLSADSEEPREFAKVHEPESGRVMTVATDQPGVQFYSGNYLEGTPAAGDEHYQARAGFCLETQIWPDASNHPHFPSTELKPGDTYHHHTILTFSCEP